MWQAATMSYTVSVLVDVGLKGVAVLALACLAARLLRRSSAAARHLVWFLAMAGLLVLPVLSLALPAWQILPAWAGVDLAGPVSPAPEAAVETAVENGAETNEAPAPGVPLAASQDVAPAGREASPAEAGGGAWHWLLALWAAGAVVALAPLLLGALSLWRLERTARPLRSGPWADLLRRLQVDLRVNRRVVLLESDRRTMPMAWGLLRPRLLIPASAAAWPAECRRVVLLHELAHVKRWDCLTQFIVRVARGLHWFNPLAWLGAHRATIEHEAACDDLVLANGGDAPRYAEHLLHVASRLPVERVAAAAAIAMARPSKLEGRLLAILDTKRNRQTLQAMAVVMAVAGVVAVVVPLATLRPAAQAEPAAAPGPAASAEPAATTPATTKASYGPAVERTVNDLDDRAGSEAVDLDTGKVVSLPQEWGRWPDAQRQAWRQGHGIDLLVDFARSRWALLSAGLDLRRVPDDAWQNLAAGDLERGPVYNAPGAEALVRRGDRLYLLPEGASPPATFTFKTRQGGRGILQITAFRDAPKGVVLRWKAAPPAVAPPHPAVQIAHVFMKAVADGRVPASADLYVPDEIHPRTAKRLREAYDLSAWHAVQAWADPDRACVVTSVVEPKVGDARRGAFGISLIRPRSQWVLRDMDFLPDAGAVDGFVTRLRRAVPAVRQVFPSSVKAPAPVLPGDLEERLNLTPEQQAMLRQWVEHEEGKDMLSPEALAAFLRTILDEKQRAVLEQTTAAPAAPVPSTQAERQRLRKVYGQMMAIGSMFQGVDRAIPKDRERALVLVTEILAKEPEFVAAAKGTPLEPFATITPNETRRLQKALKEGRMDAARDHLDAIAQQGTAAVDLCRELLGEKSPGAAPADP